MALVFRAPEAPAAVSAGLLCVLVGGGPPASRPRRELRSARRLEARPGPAAAPEHRSQALRLEVCSVPPVSATPGVLPGVHERNIAPALHRVVVWGASVKEISPQHAENGRKLGILGVCGR